MLIFNTNQLNSLQEIFVTVLILHPTLIFLAFRAYLLEPPPQDYITKGKTKKISKFKWGTHSRIHIGIWDSSIHIFFSQAKIWHQIACWYLNFYLFLPVLAWCDHNIVLKVKTKQFYDHIVQKLVKT